MSRARVAVVFTGGTLEIVGTNRLDLGWYSDSSDRATSAQILDRLPELATLADIELVDYPKASSTAIGARDWVALLTTLDTLLERSDIAGAVVSHGTNTLKETAYFLHLTTRSDKPVVLTGSMRPFSALSWDGEINLLDAVGVAASDEARGLGVLVVLNSVIHSAREVTKSATYDLQAFSSRQAGPLGYVDPDRRVRLLRRPTRRHSGATGFDPRGLSDLPRVDITLSFAGSDGIAVDALVAAQTKGLVLAGTGSGRGTPAEEEALARASRAGVIICISSRVGSGPVLRSPRLAKLGYVAAGDLLPWKARVLLALALTKEDSPDIVQSFFDTC